MPSPEQPRGRKQPFENSIPLPRGRELVTLEDAANYIVKLPRAEHTLPQWQDAMEALILNATFGGHTSLARSARGLTAPSTLLTLCRWQQSCLTNQLPYLQHFGNSQTQSITNRKWGV